MVIINSHHVPGQFLGFIAVVLKNQIAGSDILPWLSKVQTPNSDI
jgi:hypothetical protein